MAPILGSVLLMAVFCTATERMGKYGLYGRLGLGMVSIAGIFLFHGQLLDGMALYWNDMADILGSRAGIYLKRFETAGIQGGDAARMVFLIYLGMAAAVCGFLILKLKFYLLVLAWALVLPVLSGILGMEPDAGTGVIFYMGILLELNLILSRSGRKRHRAESSRAFLTGSILACAVMLAAGSFWNSLCRPKTMVPRHLSQKLKKRPGRDQQPAVQKRKDQYPSGWKAERMRCLECLRRYGTFRYHGKSGFSLPERICGKRV